MARSATSARVSAATACRHPISLIAARNGRVRISFPCQRALAWTARPTGWRAGSATIRRSRMAKATQADKLKRARMADAEVHRGAGGETHQTAGGDVPVLTTQQGTPVADDQNSLKAGARGPDASRGPAFPREDLPFRPRAHSRAGGACPRLRRARLLRDLRVALRHHHGRHLPARRGEDRGLRAVLDGRRQQGLGRPGPRRARLRRQVLHARRATGTSSATTSRSSSSRTRSSFPT